MCLFILETSDGLPVARPTRKGGLLSFASVRKAEEFLDACRVGGQFRVVAANRHLKRARNAHNGYRRSAGWH